MGGAGRHGYPRDGPAQRSAVSDDHLKLDLAAGARNAGARSGTSPAGLAAGANCAQQQHMTPGPEFALLHQGSTTTTLVMDPG